MYKMFISSQVQYVRNKKRQYIANIFHNERVV